VQPAEHPTGFLAPDVLRAYVALLAERPGEWRHAVRFTPEERHYEEIVRDEFLSAYVICWSDGHDTGYHDHDVSAGAVAVVEGRVAEARLEIGGRPTSRSYAAPESFSFEAADIHRVMHAGTEPAITLHAYSPPLVAMGEYSLGPDGRLRRHAKHHTEELRPRAAELTAA
jgi:predicted metal-dependent enzyme (double-stranded beta helix superfamily)